FELTGDPGGDGAPAWSPNGEAALFQSDRDQEGNLDIYRVAWDGTDSRRLTRDPAADRDPDWEARTSEQGGGCFLPSPRSPRTGKQPRRGRKKPPDASAASFPTAQPPPQQPADPLSVRDLRVSVARVRGRRAVVISFVTNLGASARARLVRGRRVVATRTQQVGSGRSRMVLRLPRRHAAGRYRLRLTVRSGDEQQN